MPWAGAPPRRARQATAAPAERIHALESGRQQLHQELASTSLVQAERDSPTLQPAGLLHGQSGSDVLVVQLTQLVFSKKAKQLGLPSNPQCQCPPGREHRDPWNQTMLGPQTKCSEQGHASGQPWSISVRGKDKDLTEATPD